MNWLATNHILTAITIAPLVGAVGVLCVRKEAAKFIALLASAVSLLLTLKVLFISELDFSAPDKFLVIP